MIYGNVETGAAPLAEIIRGKQHILIITHVNPDGDAVGALLGLGLALEQPGRQVQLLVPTPVPLFVRGIPGIDRIESYTDAPLLAQSIDLVILVDTGDVQRIARVWEEQRALIQARPMVVIDHHVTNSGEGVVNVVDPTISSTCELIYNLLRIWKLRITPQIATALLFGVTTDTQSFRTSNTTPSALRTAADLLELGGDMGRIVRDVYNNTPFNHGKLLALALGEMRQQGPLVWAHVTQAMQRATGVDDEAASEVTDYLSALGGFKASALFKERRDGSVKVSLRSVPGVDVAAVCKQFGGGGHRQAAGCTLDGPLAEAEQRLLAALRLAVSGKSAHNTP